MDPINLADITEDMISPAEIETVEESHDEPTQQDPLKEELERVQRKDGRSHKEKLLYTKKRIEEQLRELDGDVEPEETDDDAPITVGMWKKMQQEQTVKTALQLAEDITDQTERELTKFHLNNTIKSTGNPSEDLNLARAITNAAKNRQIIEEMSRKGTAKTHSSSSSAEAKHVDHSNIELTAEEKQFMQPPFNVPLEQIIAARGK